MIWDLVKIDKLRRAIVYAVYILLVLLLQNVGVSKLSIFGAKVLFVPAAIVAIGMFEDGVWGAMLGLFAGLLCDIAYGNTVLFTALLPVIGFFSGALSRYFVNKRFFAFMFVSLAAFALTAFCQLFRLWVFMGQDGVALIKTAVLQVLLSLPFAAALYFPCKWISRRNLE